MSMPRRVGKKNAPGRFVQLLEGLDPKDMSKYSM